MENGVKLLNLFNYFFYKLGVNCKKLSIFRYLIKYAVMLCIWFCQKLPIFFG